MESLLKANLTLFSSLLTKKFRYKHQMVLIEGKKIVEEVLQSNWEVVALIYRADWDHGYLTTDQVPIFQASSTQFKRMSSQQTPDGVLAVSRIPKGFFSSIELDNFSPDLPAFLLWGIKDPGNMGPILRTADWLGFGEVLLKENCVDVLNPKGLRLSI